METVTVADLKTGQTFISPMSKLTYKAVVIFGLEHILAEDDEGNIRAFRLDYEIRLD